jgi:hypothetical protein
MAQRAFTLFYALTLTTYCTTMALDDVLTTVSQSIEMLC